MENANAQNAAQAFAELLKQEEAMRRMVNEFQKRQAELSALPAIAPLEQEAKHAVEQFCTLQQAWEHSLSQLEQALTHRRLAQAQLKPELAQMKTAPDPHQIVLDKLKPFLDKLG